MKKGQSQLKRWESRAEWPLAVCAVLFLAAYSIEVLGDPGNTFTRIASWVTTALYVPFIVDYVARLSLAENSPRWFVRHPLDLAVVTLPFLAPLRFLRLVAIVKVLQRAFGDAVRGRLIAFTTFGALLIIYSASLAEFKAERFAPGSRITTFNDALWWAIATITTVGYGDYVPVTKAGRMIAVLVMLGGISLIGVITATVAHWIVSQVNEEDAANQAATVQHIQTLRDDIDRLKLLVGNQILEAPVDPAGGSGSASAVGPQSH